MRIWITFFIVLLVHFHCIAQKNSPQVETQPSNAGLSIIFENGDSVSAQYFSVDKPEILHQFDALAEMHPSAQYDPIKLEEIDYINIGNIGSSAFPLHFNWNSNINFDLGYHQFDIYKKSLDNTKLVRSNVPISNLGFSPISGRQNFIVDALFSNSYKEELLLNVDYRRINQDGYFLNQTTKATNVGFHLYWTPKTSYSSLASLFVNNNSEGQNGGITTDTFFGRDFYENLINIPVFSTDASSRYQNRSFVVNQYFSVTKDSSLVHLDLHHELTIETGYYRYFDNTIEESEYTQYPNFITDSRGLRHIVEFSRFKNSVDIETSLKDNIILRSGLNQSYFGADDEFNEFSVNEISLYGDLVLKLYERINLQAKLQLGLVNNNGNLSLESIAQIDIPGANTLKGGFNFSRFASSYVHRNLSITQQPVWEEDYGKQIQSEIWASIYLKRVNTKITASQMLLDNIIYLDPNQVYFQNSDVLSFSKLIIENNVQFKNLHSENTLLIQTFSDNVFNFPSIWFRNILYVDLPLFGDVVDSNLGIESRLTPARNLRFYNPILGDVYSTNESSEFYPELSLFGVFDVGDFRLFVRAENAFNVIDDAFYYHHQSYPQNEFKVRFGFRWFLVN